jgi:chorismate mutase/prephenate dehydratase
MLKRKKVMDKSDEPTSNSKETSLTPASNSLLNIRDSISTLDSQLISLLGQRRELSQSVAKEKQHIDKPLRDKGREQQLLESLLQKASEAGLDSHYITRLFNAIIEDSVLYQQDYLQSLNNPGLKSQKSKSLAVLGGKGAYSYLAAKKFFCNSDNTYLACSSFDKVLKSVADGKVDYGIIPIENTTSGGITEVYDLLLDSGLTIIGEEKYAVNHCLIASNEAQLNDIKTVAAHPEASIQCSRDLKKLVSANIQLVESTAHALHLVAEKKKPTHAAIASAEAAELFGLKVLKSNITNQSENFTRFLVLAKNPIKVSLSVQCKTSIALSTGQKAGSLADVLGLFRDANIPLSRLESRPIPHKPWEQMFYIDLVGNINDDKLANTIGVLTNHCLFLRVLGSYPTEDISATQVSPHSLAKNKLSTMQSDKNILLEQPKQQGGTQNKETRKSYHLASREHKSSDTIIKVQNALIGDNNFIVIAGPCAVESQEQIMSCAKHASETGVAILRGGCFKPRTSPYSFQGLGFPGLDLMQQAGQKYSLPIITEVMSPDDVKTMAKQADVLQIGARNMQNFALLKAVGEVNIPVMLKRGLMATIDELLNAAEYILSHGNLQVFLCERGIRTFETATRNTLDLSAVPVLKRLTHLPIIVDPSHAVGDRELVLPMAKAAKAVGADGIIIEFHPNPEKALSDGPQALRYNEFTEMMEILYR